MASERVAEPLMERGVVEHLSTALTLVPLIQCQTFYDFQKNTFQMMCFNPKRCRGPNLSFFNLEPWAIIIHGIAKFIGLPNMNIDDTI